MAHTEYYRAKQEMMKKFKEELKAQMEQIKANVREKQLQELFQIAKKKEETKMLLRIESEERHREKMRQKYADLKSDKERYEKYLEHQTKYREKKRQERREEALEKLKEAFGEHELAKYEVGDKFIYCTKSGRFFSEYGTELYGHFHPNGYVELSFCGKNMMAHRVLWEAFNGKIPKGMEIDHINNIRSENQLSNLRLCSHKENCNNPRSIENYKKHNKSVDRSYLSDYWKSSKRSREVYQYTLDGKLVKEWASAAEAALNGGFAKQLIYQCCKGRLKSHHGFIWSYVKKTD